MERFINCNCIKNKNGELIPLWEIDWKLDSDYEDSDDPDLKNSFIEPAGYEFGQYVSDSDIVRALWDLVDKKVIPCKRIIRLYTDSPGEHNAEFKEGDEIFVKHRFSSNLIYPTKIKSISQGPEEGIYYTTEDRLKDWITSEDRIIENVLVSEGSDVIQIITYRKHYILEDGTETDYSYDFLKLKEK